MDIFKFTEQQMFDYMLCPTLYDLKYNKRFAIEDRLTIKDLLRKTSMSYFTYKFMEKRPTLDIIKNKWDTVCSKNSGILSQAKAIEGMGLLHKFFLWAEDQNFKVISINSNYIIKIGNYEMAGVNGLICSHGSMIELVVPDFSNKMPEQVHIDMNMKYSIDCYSFFRLYNRSLSGIRIHNVKNDKDFLSVRSYDDFKRVESTINNVAKGIENDIFYPNGNGCHYCDAALYCRGWCK